MMYDEGVDSSGIKIDKRRQTERLLADQQADPNRERGESIATFDTFAENVKDSKTKLCRMAALATVIAFIVSVVIFGVFVWPVQLDENSYHSNFQNILGKWSTAFSSGEISEYMSEKFS